MTTYRLIASTETDPQAPYTSALAKAQDLNSRAIAECDTTAPVNAACWHPYDMVFANDGATGKFWDFSIDGLSATITSPTMADGWDYMIRWVGLSHNAGAGRDIELDVGGSNLILESGALAANVVSGTLQIDIPTMEDHVRYVTYTRRNAAGTNVGPSTVVVLSNFATPVTSMAFSLSGTGSFDAGTVFFYRRRNYISG